MIIYKNASSSRRDSCRNWPLFSENFLNGDRCKKKYTDQFYIQFDNSENIVEKMDYSYFGINDLVFDNKVWSYCKKATVFTTLKPNPVI